MDNWQTGPDKIAKRGKCLLESGEWYDCKFLLGESPNQEIVSAHKLILAMSSSVFAAMFYGNDSQASSDPITLPDVQPETFKVLLKYIYTDELLIASYDLAMELYPCAMRYKIMNVVTECVNYLGSCLWPERVFPLFDFARRHGEAHLLDQCVAAMCINTDQIITSENWKNASKEAIFTLFNLHFLVIVSELDLFEALLVWARAQCHKQSLPLNRQSMRLVAGDLLKYIRFLTFGLKHFQLAPGKEEILEESEIDLISQRLTAFKKKTPLPEGFSQEHTERVIPRAFAVKDWRSPKRKELRYCFRTFGSLMLFDNVDNLRSSLVFSVDTPILLYGIKVSSQLPTIEEVPTPYLESLSAFLVFPEGDTALLKQFVRDVKPDSAIPVEFNSVLRIEPFKNHRICVQFNKPGRYPAVDGCSTEEECAGVMFWFNRGPNEHSIRSGLIRGILFSKMVQPPAANEESDLFLP